jgi:hypothetical protein
MTEVKQGWIKYHNGPKTVCLYTVTTSRLQKQSKSVLPNLFKFKEKNLFLGVISKAN